MLFIAYPKMSPVSQESKTAATRPAPTERALKTDLLSILAGYQQHYSNTNQCGTQQLCTGTLYLEKILP